MPAKDTSHLDGAYLGEREPAVLFSSRALPNVHGIGAVEVLSDPFYDEDAEGFVTSPGGTRGSPASTTPLSPQTPPQFGRDMILHRGPVGSLARVAYPSASRGRYWSDWPKVPRVERRGRDHRCHPDLRVVRPVGTRPERDRVRLHRLPWWHP